MARRKTPQHDPSILVAKIETVEQTYYLSEYPEYTSPVGDEGLIDIVGRIEKISPAHKRHLGLPIDISLACERSFPRGERTPPTDRPFLLPLYLKKDRCHFMAYMPADAFWAMRPMITSGAITHIEARFGPPRYGNADLLSIFFSPASKLTVEG